MYIYIYIFFLNFFDYVEINLRCDLVCHFMYKKYKFEVYNYKKNLSITYILKRNIF